MSIYESSITNPKKQLEFYKQLSEQLQQENEQLKADYGTQAQIERDMLQQENKILKENAENNDKVVDKVNWENQLLKKRLEENQNPLKGIFAQVNDDTLLRDCGNMNAEIKELKTQQKEFIEYLENEINKIKEQIKNYDIWHEVGTDINFLILKKQFNIEILSKYKEIIGDDIE